MKALSFIWLELTSRCNLKCVHCYSESGPQTGNADTMAEIDFLALLDSAAALGCRQVQFTGGEPTLVPFLPKLIAHAKEKEFEFIEVFTNATIISKELLSRFLMNNVAIATSFYSHDPSIHDEITKTSGSHASTVHSLERFLEAGLNIRVGIIEMDINREKVDKTINFLECLGIKNVGRDKVRGVGRGNSFQRTPITSHLSELCGKCWQGSVAVGPDGVISPCIMSKSWSIGSVREKSFNSLVMSPELYSIRRRIYEEVWLTKKLSTFHQCDPQCNPQCQPTCAPRCSPTCNPIACNPRACWPSVS